MLVTPHLSLGATPRVAPRSPDLSLLDDTVAPHILDAMRAASAQLTAIGVRHLLVGGLAVGAWGHPRATKNVDFLIGPESFEHHPNGIVTMKAGVPIQFGRVSIAILSATANDREDVLATPVLGEVPVAPLPTLIYLKLRSPRPKDFIDVMELIRAGIDRDAVRAELVARSPELVAKWDRAVTDTWSADD